MALLKFTNFASTTVATASVGTGDLSLAVAAGTGTLFPTLGAGEYFYATLVDSLTAPTKKEIVKVTARATDTLTIVRAQDNTTAQTWVMGNYIALRPVAAWFSDTTWRGITGTANQVDVANNGTSIVLSTPQSIHNAASPTFAGLTLSGLTQHRVPVVGASGSLTNYAGLQYVDGDVEDTQNLMTNGGLSATTLAAWGVPGSGTVFRLGVGQTGDNSTVYEVVALEPDTFIGRTDTLAPVVFYTGNDAATGSGGAFHQVYTANGSTGDPYYIARQQGTSNSWSWGLDKSDSSAWVLSQALTLGTNNAIRVDLTSYAISISGSLKSSNATGGVGYGTGAGGTVTQITSKATGVTLSKVCGQITTHAAALNAATIVSFVLTNTAIAAGDVLILNHVSGGTLGAYTLNASCGAGSATIYLRNNTAGNLSEALVIGFVLIKAVVA